MPETAISFAALVPSETETLPLIAPATAGVAVIEIVQVAATANVVPEHPVAVIPVPLTETVIGPEALVPALVTVTVLAVAVFPTSTDPRSTDGGLTVRIAPPVPASVMGTVPVASVAGFASVGFLLLPPQPATASMPTSPKQVAWSNRSKFLEHVME
jgi:hypothetical protein